MPFWLYFTPSNLPLFTSTQHEAGKDNSWDNSRLECSLQQREFSPYFRSICYMLKISNSYLKIVILTTRILSSNLRESNIYSCVCLSVHRRGGPTWRLPKDLFKLLLLTTTSVFHMRPWPPPNHPRCQICLQGFLYVNIIVGYIEYFMSDLLSAWNKTSTFLSSNNHCRFQEKAWKKEPLCNCTFGTFRCYTDDILTSVEDAVSMEEVLHSS